MKQNGVLESPESWVHILKTVIFMWPFRKRNRTSKSTEKIEWNFWNNQLERKKLNGGNSLAVQWLGLLSVIHCQRQEFNSWSGTGVQQCKVKFTINKTYHINTIKNKTYVLNIYWKSISTHFKTHSWFPWLKKQKQKKNQQTKNRRKLP